MNDVVSFARSAIVAALVVWNLAHRAVADDNLTFDFGSPRKFSGLGIQLWAPTEHQAERDALLRDLHVKYVRMVFAAKVSEDQLKNHMSVPQISAVIAKNVDDEETTLYSRLHDEVSQLHVGLNFVFFQVPSIWCFNADDSELAHGRINPDHIQDYANWITANLLYARRVRLSPSEIELINEPDSSSSTQFTPEQYDALLVAVRATLDRNGLSAVGIDGPGVGYASTVEAYTQVLERTGHIALLKALSWHDNDTVRRPEPAGFAGVRLDLLANAHQLPIAVTDFTSENPQWDRPPYDSGLRNRGENNAADSSDFGVSVAAEAVKLVGDGANSLFFWQAEDPSWTEDAFGLLNADGQRKPAAAALQLLFEHMPAKCDVAGTKQAYYGLAAACFRTESRFILATANLSPEARTINAQITNAPSPTKVMLVRQFDSHGPTPHTVPSTTVTIDGPNISTTLPSRSVTIIVLR